jgi:hypothetical protein
MEIWTNLVRAGEFFFFRFLGGESLMIGEMLTVSGVTAGCGR